MRKTPTPVPITQDDAHKVPWPDGTTHKHSRGRLAVIAGGPLQTGAARLAARAGQRMGAGWVSLFGTKEACGIMAAHETSILIDPRDDLRALSEQVANFDAVIVGPAFGLDMAQRDDVLDLICHYQGALVLDADALRHIASAKRDAFAALKARASRAILTPHSGEFSALFGSFDEQHKAVATRDAARKCGCILVHKGASTIVAGLDGALFVNDIAAPFLATAGTGDVLAGMLGGLLAQGAAGLDACKAAIWLHTMAARRLGAGLIAEDLVSELRPVLIDIAPNHLKPTNWRE